MLSISKRSLSNSMALAELNCSADCRKYSQCPLMIKADRDIGRAFSIVCQKSRSFTSKRRSNAPRSSPSAGSAPSRDVMDGGR